MKNKFNIDEFGIFLVWTGIILSIISYFAKSSFLNYLAGILVIYAIYRFFSRNTAKRSMENTQFKNSFLNPVKKSFKGFKKNSDSKKNFKYVKCPSCNQKLRIPNKKGKIKVRCPKCGNKFDARS
jgi:MJ0042 family finger-like protein